MKATNVHYLSFFLKILRGIFTQHKKQATTIHITHQYLVSAPQKACKDLWGRLIVVVLMGGYIISASAANISFDNGAGTGDWGTATNWDTDTVPTSADTAIIGGGFTVTGTLADDILQLDYTSTGTSVISGGGFSVLGQIDNSSSGQVDFTGDAGGLTNSNAGAINLTGDVTGALNSSGSGMIDVTGELSTTGGTTQSNISDGAVTVGQLNNAGGADVNLTGGSLTINGTAVSNAVFSSVNVSNATLNALDGFSNLNRSLLMVGTGGEANITGTLVNNSGFSGGLNSNVEVRGGMLNVDTYSAARGNLIVGDGGEATLGSYSHSRGVLRIETTGGVITVTGNATSALGTTQIQGGEFNVGGNLTRSSFGGMTFSGTSVTNVGGQLINNTGGFSATTGSVNIQDDAQVQSGSFNNAKGILNVSGGLLRTTTGALSNTFRGTMNFSGGMVDAQSGLSNSGTTNLNGTGDVQVAGTLSNSGTFGRFNVTSVDATLNAENLFNSNVFNLDAGTVNVSNAATIQGGNGLLDQDGGEFNVNGLLTTAGGGTINLDAGVLNANGGMVNNGTTNVQNAGDFSVSGGDLDNGGTLNLLGGTSVLDIVNLTSAGRLNLDTGTVDVSGTATIENGGELDQDGGTIDVAGLLITQGTGTINLDAGVLNANGGMVNDGTTNLQAVGDLNLTGDLDNGGTFNVLGGLDALDIQNMTSSGLFNLDTNTVNIAGTATIENGGELDQDGGTMDIVGLLTTETGGTINLDAGVLTANAGMVNDGTTNLQAMGDLNLTGDLDNGGTFNVLGGADALTIQNLTSSGLFNLDTNIVNVAGTATIENGGELDQDGGTMDIVGLLTTETGGTINLDAGTLNANAGIDNMGDINFTAVSSLITPSITNRTGSSLNGAGVLNSSVLLEDNSLVNGLGGGLSIDDDVTGTGAFTGTVTLNAGYRPVTGVLHTIQHENTTLAGTTYLEIGNNRQNDQLIANGTFTLGGDLVVTQLNGTQVEDGDTFDLVVAAGAGTLVGDFTGVSFMTSPLLEWTINSDPSLYQIEAARIFVGTGLTSGLDLNPQQREALSGIDDTTLAYFTSNPDLNVVTEAIINGINAGDTQAVAFAAQGLAGNSIAHLPEFLDRHQQLLMDEVFHRHSPSWHSESASNPGSSMYASLNNGKILSDASSALEEDENQHLDYNYGIIGISEVDVDEQNSGALGYDGDIRNLILGYEYEVNPSKRVGLALAYSQLRTDTDDGFAETETNTYALITHAHYQLQKGWDIRSVLGTSWVDVDEAKRRVFPGLEVEGDTEGYELFSSIEGGYEWQTEKGYFLRPFARLSFTYSKLDGYTERGPGSLDFDDAKHEVFRSHIGLEYTSEWKLNDGKSLSPNVLLRWDQQLSESSKSIMSTFVGGGGEFETFQLDSPDWQVLTRVNLDYHLYETLKVFNNMHYVQGKDSESHQYGLHLGLEYRF